jgi:hypothetical protein
VLDESLLDEVTALVEWPVAVVGRFDERFLTLQREVLLSTLQEHQRYFAVENAQGALLPLFITVSNIESREPLRVREGNERVVRPRLSDAAFFQAQDRRKPLVETRAGLDREARRARCEEILADLRIDPFAALPILERFDELERMRALYRFIYFGVRRGGASVADILADGAVQQRRVLRHHGDPGA